MTIFRTYIINNYSRLSKEQGIIRNRQSELHHKLKKLLFFSKLGLKKWYLGDCNVVHPLSIMIENVGKVC